MQTIIRRTLIATAVLPGLLLAGAAIFVVRFDPDDYKPQLVRLVEERYQRKLAIPGDIRLAFLPRLGVELGPLRVSAQRSDDEFAAVDRARLSLALLPLLAGRFVIDQVQVDGLRLQLRRNQDGSSNIDDLLARQKEGQGESEGQQDRQQAGKALRFAVDSIRLSDAQLDIDDRMQDRKLTLSDLDLDSGRIAEQVPGQLRLSTAIRSSSPQLDGQLRLATGFRFDLAQKRYAVQDMEGRFDGKLLDLRDAEFSFAGTVELQPGTRRFILEGIRLAASGKRDAHMLSARLHVPRLMVGEHEIGGGKLDGEASMGTAGRSLSARFAAPEFNGRRQDFRLPALQVDAAIRQDGLDARLKLSGALAGNVDTLSFASPRITMQLSGTRDEAALAGTVSTALAARLQEKQIELSQLQAALSLPNPGGGAMAVKAQGGARLDLARGKADAMLKGRLDESGFDARLGMTSFSPAAYTFDIDIDRIALDRYRSKVSGPPAARQAPSPAVPPAAAEPAFDLSALHDLSASGNARIGWVRLAGMEASNLRFKLHASGGKLDMEPFAADLYGGSTSGAVSIQAGKPARIAMRQNLAGIDVGRLLRDAAGKDAISGRGDVLLDLASTGDSPAQIKQGLRGDARLVLRDGAIRGVNIAQAVRAAKARIGELRGRPAPQEGKSSGEEKTDFTELAGSFRIAQGVARNEDLLVKSPLLRVTGAGDIDIAGGRLDYLARATVVASLQGQGGPELQSLKGLTVPVRLRGPFGQIGWQIDFAGMAAELARQQLDERKAELEQKARKSLDEQKEKIRRQLDERLKGLLGK